MSKLKIEKGQNAFSLVTFREQIKYWENSVGILVFLLFL